MTRDEQPVTLRLAGVQVESRNGEVEANLAHAEGFVASARERGAQLVLCPEFLAPGYVYDPSIWQAAEPRGGPTERWLRRLAIEHHIHIGASYLEASGDDFFNTFPGSSTICVPPNEPTASDDRDPIAGTPWHEHVRARVEAVGGRPVRSRQTSVAVARADLAHLDGCPPRSRDTRRRGTLTWPPPVLPAKMDVTMADSDPEDFAALFAASEAERPRERRVAAGDVVRGRVIAVGATAAFVAVGGKAEATIELGEFRDPATGEVQLHEGDEIEATVVDDGTRSGSIVLKRVAGRGGHVPGELEQAFAHGIAIEGLVTGENKGGYDVQIGSVRAFCPGSQIDRRRIQGTQYVGQRLRFRITKLEAGGRNVVVSRRQLLDEEAAEQGRAVWAELRVGAVVGGTVTSLRDFGAFVDLGGIDGLIHVSELGYGRASHPSDVLQVGQRVEAQVVKLEPDPKGGRGRVGLSLRALAPDPWATAAERFPVGASVCGTVRRLEQFGAFVELAPGLDGLVHVSRLALDRHVSHPRQIVAIGDTVDVTVVDLDPAKRRIGLSMVERARQVKDATEAEERRDTEKVLAQASEKPGLGTLADLLAKSPSRKR